MWLSVSLPDFGVPAFSARVSAVHAQEGAQLGRGDALFDLRVDLSGGVTRDCPPVSSCRIILREQLWLRRLLVEQGAEMNGPTMLALLSTDPDSSPEEPAREARVTAASMLIHSDWWSGGG